MHPTSLIGAANAPCFTDYNKYCANITVATSLVALHLYFQNSPINWAVSTGNGNKANLTISEKGSETLPSGRATQRTYPYLVLPGPSRLLQQLYVPPLCLQAVRGQDRHIKSKD